MLYFLYAFTYALKYSDYVCYIFRMLYMCYAYAIYTGDAREVHDFSTLLGFGADGVCPYMAYEALSHMNSEGVIQARAKQSFTDEELFYSYRKSAAKGMYI